MARTKGKPSEVRKVWKRFRVTIKESRAIAGNAKAAGMTESRWMRTRAMEPLHDGG